MHLVGRLDLLALGGAAVGKDIDDGLLISALKLLEPRKEAKVGKTTECNQNSMTRTRPTMQAVPILEIAIQRQTDSLPRPFMAERSAPASALALKPGKGRTVGRSAAIVLCDPAIDNGISLVE